MVHDELFYWLKDKTPAKAEVDFVLQSGMNIIPVEVKSGSVLKLKSLHQFCVEKKSKLGVVISEKKYARGGFTYKNYDGEKTGDHKSELLVVPFYLIERLSDLVKEN